MSLKNSDGTTRGVLRPHYLLHTPDTFVRTPLPGITRGLAIVHAAPALGAGFLQYTAELEPGGTLAPCARQRFLYVLAGEGALSLEDENYTDGSHGVHALRAGAFAYLPAGEHANLTATTGNEPGTNTGLRLAVIEKRYEPLAGVQPPRASMGYVRDVPAQPLNGDPGIQVRTLLPADPRSPFAYDFAVNTMTYAADAALGQVEIHVMEHGLIMLDGAGTYLLGEERHEVAAGDFIWMAPFCPQWFVARGAPAAYLIYKDWNRSPAP